MSWLGFGRGQSAGIWYVVTLGLAVLVASCSGNKGNEGNDSTEEQETATISRITGASWPASGVATTATTGLDRLFGGSWTHVGSTDLPPGFTSTGYIETSEGEAAYFRIDNATAPLKASNDYWVRFWVYPERVTGTPLAVDRSGLSMHTISDGESKLRSVLYLVNNSSANGTQGITILVASPMGGTVSHIDSLGGGIGPSVIPLNAWTELTVHLSLDAADARYGFYINRVLVGEVSGIDTTSINLSALRDNWDISFGNFSGLKFRISGPIESWSGTDIPMRPLYSLEPSSSYRTRKFAHHFARTKYSHGLMFTYTGTATMTPVSYAAGGINPQRRRIVVSGATRQTAKIMSIDSIGTLPFNEEGWATVFFTDFYLPGSGTTCDFILRNAADTADVIRLTYDGNNLTEGSRVLKADLAKTSRWKLALHLHERGEATYSLIDETAGPWTTQTYFSGVLANWVPQPIGRVGFEAVHGDTSFELGAISVHRWLELSGFDSLSTAAIKGLSPEAQGPSRVGGQFAQQGDQDLIPNMWRRRPEWVARGYGRRGIDANTGRSGLSRASWNTNVGVGMTYARGIILWNIDGGSINDVGVRAANQATADLRAAGLVAELDETIRLVLHHGNRMILSTMIRREQGTYNTYDLSIIDQFNDAVRERTLTHRSSVYFSDPAKAIMPNRSLFAPGDDVHFHLQGDTTVAAQMIETLVP
jgi:hypothetical protein